MYFGQELLLSLGRHVLPGLVSLVVSAGVLCLWNMQRVDSSQTRVGGGTHRLTLVIGIILAVAACVLIIARFIAID